METTKLSIYEMHRDLCYKEGKGILELEIKGGKHETFAGLCEYYKIHYKPLLEQLAKEKPDTAARFMAEDMNALFLGYLEEYEQD